MTHVRNAAVAVRAGRVVTSVEKYPGKSSTIVPDGIDAHAAPHVVRVTGVLDLSNSGALEEKLCALVAAGDTRLIVDLSGLRLCAAAGMSGLERVSRWCAENGGWLRLAAPAGIVDTAFRIVSFGHSVDIYPTVAAAATHDRVMR